MQPEIKRVTHVTEAMGGGVITFLQSITSRQADEGVAVEVLYASRPETPDWPSLKGRFDHRVTVSPPIEAAGIRRTWRMFIAIRRAIKTSNAIHLHSSIAGAVGRLAYLSVPSSRGRVFYSPHGYAFLREDYSRIKRSVFLLAERLFARIGDAILTSHSEIVLADSKLGAPRAAFLQSGVPTETISSAERPIKDDLPTVTMVGRMVFQKGPWRFAAVARKLSGRARFVWVGGGNNEDRKRWIGDAPVSVVDWVEPPALEELLSETDVLLFPSLWEGSSLSLIQAQGRGIPAVTTNVVGNRDTVLHGITGFVCDTDGQLSEAVGLLLDDPDRRAWMSRQAVNHALVSLTDDAIGRDSLRLYRSDLKDVAPNSSADTA